MSALYILQLILQAGMPTIEEGDIQDLLSFGAGVFAFGLFLIALYAWTRRRQPALLIVSAAFLLFFIKAVIQLLPQQTNATNLILTLIDFVILAAFFIALVIKPRRRGSEGA